MLVGAGMAYLHGCLTFLFLLLLLLIYTEYLTSLLGKLVTMISSHPLKRTRFRNLLLQYSLISTVESYHGLNLHLVATISLFGGNWLQHRKVQKINC